MRSSVQFFLLPHKVKSENKSFDIIDVEGLLLGLANSFTNSFKLYDVFMCYI